jgi:UDP-GlcNAc:undecaprenyl-phosphate GlcNAc-1-phosphate transferase
MLLLIGFALTSLLLVALPPLAHRVGLIDHPGGRKCHQEPTPVIGGLAMFLGFALMAFSAGTPLNAYQYLLLGSALLVTVGVLDDCFQLSPAPRFLAQFLAALLMIVGGKVVLVDLGMLIVPGQVLTLGWLSIPFTLFATLGVINAINMSDGSDGLSVSLILVALAGLLVLMAAAGDLELVPPIACLITVLVAFFAFNHPFRGPARVFMGDAGSLFLGFALSWVFIQYSQGEARILAPVTALWLLALPIIDTLIIMARRIHKGRSPLSGDREHFHHILLAAGFSPAQTLVAMVLMAVLAATIGVAGQLVGIAEYLMFAGFLILLGLHAGIVSHAWKTTRWLHGMMGPPHPGRSSGRHSEKRSQR